MVSVLHGNSANSRPWFVVDQSRTPSWNEQPPATIWGTPRCVDSRASPHREQRRGGLPHTPPSVPFLLRLRLPCFLSLSLAQSPRKPPMPGRTRQSALVTATLAKSPSAAHQCRPDISPGVPRDACWMVRMPTAGPNHQKGAVEPAPERWPVALRTPRRARVHQDIRPVCSQLHANWALS